MAHVTRHMHGDMDGDTFDGGMQIANRGTSHGASLGRSGWWLTYPSKKYEFVSWDDFPFPIHGQS